MRLVLSKNDNKNNNGEVSCLCNHSSLVHPGNPNKKCFQNVCGKLVGDSLDIDGKINPQKNVKETMPYLMLTHLQTSVKFKIKLVEWLQKLKCREGQNLEPGLIEMSLDKPWPNNERSPSQSSQLAFFFIQFNILKIMDKEEKEIAERSS